MRREVLKVVHVNKGKRVFAYSKTTTDDGKSFDTAQCSSCGGQLALKEKRLIKGDIYYCTQCGTLAIHKEKRNIFNIKIINKGPKSRFKKITAMFLLMTILSGAALYNNKDSSALKIITSLFGGLTIGSPILYAFESIVNWIKEDDNDKSIKKQ